LFYLTFDADQSDGTVSVSNISLIYDYVYPADTVISEPDNNTVIEANYAMVAFHLRSHNEETLSIDSAYLAVDGATADSCSDGCYENTYNEEYYLIIAGLAPGEHIYNVTAVFETSNYTSGTRRLNVTGPIYPTNPQNNSYAGSSEVSAQYMTYWNLTDSYAVYDGNDTRTCERRGHKTDTIWPSSREYIEYYYVCNQSGRLTMENTATVCLEDSTAWNTQSEETVFYVDTLTPQVDITSPADASTAYSRNLIVYFSASDEQRLDTCEIELNGEGMDWHSYNSTNHVNDSFELELDEDGIYEIWYAAMTAQKIQGMI